MQLSDLFSYKFSTDSRIYAWFLSTVLSFEPTSILNVRTCSFSLFRWAIPWYNVPVNIIFYMTFIHLFSSRNENILKWPLKIKLSGIINIIKWSNKYNFHIWFNEWRKCHKGRIAWNRPGRGIYLHFWGSHYWSQWVFCKKK